MATVYHTPPPEAPQRAAGPLKLAGQFTLGVLFLISVLLLGWLVFDIATSHFVSLDAKRVGERKKILEDRQAEDQKLLHDAPSWQAKDKGLVRVPIDQAMTLTVAALRAEKPHAAYPIATPATDSGAPTSPDKGAGSVPGQNTNPPASNPTVGHPVPTPAPSATPAVPAAGSPGATAAPASANPSPGPATRTPAANNNAHNPGPAPIPGTQPQPQPTPAADAAPTPAPHTGPAPLATPPSQPTPAGTPAAGGGPTPTPTPSTSEPGANPSGTP